MPSRATSWTATSLRTAHFSKFNLLLYSGIDGCTDVRPDPSKGPGWYIPDQEAKAIAQAAVLKAANPDIKLFPYITGFMEPNLWGPYAALFPTKTRLCLCHRCRGDRFMDDTTNVAHFCTYPPHGTLLCTGPWTFTETDQRDFSNATFMQHLEQALSSLDDKGKTASVSTDVSAEPHAPPPLNSSP